MVDWTIGEWKNSSHPAKRFIYFLTAWIVGAIVLCYGLALALSFVDDIVSFIKTYRQYSLLIILVLLTLIFLLNKFVSSIAHQTSKTETSDRTGSLPNNNPD